MNSPETSQTTAKTKNVLPSSAGHPMMRYLYGDSAHFPLQFNFLQTLEVFVASAVRAVELEAQSRLIQAQLAGTAAARLRGVEALEQFHVATMRTLRDSCARSTDGLSLDYARQLSEQASRIVEGARAQAVSANEREAGQGLAEAERRRTEIRAVTEAFFKAGRLPIVESRLAMRLPIGKEPQHELSGTVTFADTIVVGYTLSADALPDWRHPRKVSEFAEGINLMVGAKKSWFKKTVQPDMVALDDLIVSSFDLSEDTARIALRKRADQADSYIFVIRRVDTSLVAEVHHPDDPEAEGQLPAAVDANDRVQLERLWQLLKSATMPALEHKTRVISVHLDGEDVFASEKVAQLITRIVKLLAPTVAEIARRSSNQQELSLKIEHDGGRREEIYLKKADLLSKLGALGPQERAVFAPLALGQVEPKVLVAASE